MTTMKISAAALKNGLSFAVTVNGRAVASFAYPSDAADFAKTARVARPDLDYQVVEII